MPTCGLSNEISSVVNEHFKGRQNLKLFEAGCGSASYFGFDGVSRAAGIDISQEILDKNNTLHDKICGDLHDHPLPRNEFDIVVCWDVLEHLDRPRQALDNIFKTVSQDGVVVLGFPNVLSIKGLVTKFTPYWFHVWFYKHIMKYDFVPFPTYLRSDIIPERVVQFGKRNGFSASYYRLTNGLTRRLAARFWPCKALFNIVDTIWRMVTLGKHPSLLNDSCAIVLRRNVPSA